MRIALALLLAAAARAQSNDMIVSRYLSEDLPLTTDPSAALWTRATPVIADRDRWGAKVPGHATEIRSRWSPAHLYLFFVCPYEKLHLKPNPVTDAETDRLWEWDVAEAFIGTDFQNIRHYTEYEVSPQGEWVDLDIERANPNSPHIRWNSGFESAARIDEARKVWYAAMKIPLKALGVKASNGTRLRINFFRVQGPPPKRTHITWQPPKSETFHVPEAFGWMQFDGAPGNRRDAK